MGFSCVCRYRLKMEEPSRVPEAPSTVAQGNKHRNFCLLWHPGSSELSTQNSVVQSVRFQGKLGGGAGGPGQEIRAGRAFLPEAQGPLMPCLLF